MTLVLIFIGSLVALFLLIGYAISAPAYKGPVTDHFNGKVFINPGNVKPTGFSQLFKWLTNREQGVWKTVHTLRTAQPGAPPTTGFQITYVNHSTFLIQTAGLSILTDPVWSERVSPLSWLGPRRMKPPGIALDDLPKIDLILLTHNHYDHLDIVTLRQLVARFQPSIIVPLGVDLFLKKHGIASYAVLDWWQTAMVNSITIEAVPAQHFSSRGTFDRNTTLWCGYVIRQEGGNLYFAGDTGYNHTTFREIGERCKPIRVALIPIGAYKPAWFMSPIHCSPEEAVQIHHDVQAQHSIAMHAGTFPLADDGMYEPAEALHQELRRQQITNFTVLDNGELMQLD